MGIHIHDGKNCPCPSDCVRRGNCAACIKFHRSRNEPTYCEYLHSRLEAGQPDTAAVSGKELRLLDYGPCAG